MIDSFLPTARRLEEGTRGTGVLQLSPCRPLTLRDRWARLRSMHKLTLKTRRLVKARWKGGAIVLSLPRVQGFYSNGGDW